MRANQLSQFPDQALQNEMQNLYSALARIAFGSTTFQRCENIDGYLVQVNFAASGTDVSAAHDLKRTPSNWLQVWTNASGSIYESSSGVSANSDTTAWFRATVVGDYRIIVI